MVGLGRAARAARAAPAAARRRGPVRARAQAHAARSCPRCVGLVTAPGSAAERDVLENARRRWPSVPFREVVRRHAGAARRRRGDRGVRAARPRPRGRRDRDRPRRRLGRGPAAVLRRGADPRRPRADVRRSSPRSATSRTRRSSTWSPTSARPPRPTPPSWWSPTWPRSCAASPGPATGSAPLLRQLLDRGAGRAGPPCARARPSPTRATLVRGAASTRSPSCVERARRTLGHALDRAADDIAHQRARARALSPLATLRRGLRRRPGRRRARADLRRRASSRGLLVRCGWPTVASTSTDPRHRDPRTTATADRHPGASDELTKLTYEAAREELIEVVRKLEAGGTTLEESLALWERGEQLATVCQEWLDGARSGWTPPARRTPLIRGRPDLSAPRLGGQAVTSDCRSLVGGRAVDQHGLRRRPRRRTPVSPPSSLKVAPGRLADLALDVTAGPLDRRRSST